MNDLVDALIIVLIFNEVSGIRWYYIGTTRKNKANIALTNVFLTVTRIILYFELMGFYKLSFFKFKIYRARLTCCYQCVADFKFHKMDISV